jgi:phosphate starvation-inducible PhoH-like protein
MEEQPNAHSTADAVDQADKADEGRVIALTRRVILEPNDSQRLSALCGPVDQNVKHLEKRLNVHIRNRGNEFQISGPEPRVEAAAALLQQLYRETYDRQTIEPDFVHLYLQEAGVEELVQSTPDQAEGGGAGYDDGEVVIYLCHTRS